MDLFECDASGWELNNPDPDLFDLQIVQIWGGCEACPCRAMCAVPCESMRRLMPKAGRFIGLGNEKRGDGSKMSYFALLLDDEVKFVRLTSPQSYWATASCISYELVPAWALSRFKRQKELKV